MGRAENRKALRFARKLADSDLSVVTAHYKTDYIQVITEQSSYVIDLKNKRALRIAGDEASHLEEDSQWYEYEQIFSCSVSFPLRMTWKNQDRLIMRTTTPITEVNELTEEEAMKIASQS
jgi:hypothetical protein